MASPAQVAQRASSRLALRSAPCPRCTPTVRRPSYQPQRNLTSTTHRAAAPRLGNISARVQSHMGESTATRMKSVKKSKMPNDMGLFPKSFIAGPWHDYLGLMTTRTKFWFRIQWLLVKTPVMSLASTLYMYKWSRWRLLQRNAVLDLKKPLPAQFTNRIRIALKLHKELNQAIAAGDKAWLNENACQGLLGNVTAQLAKRAKSGVDKPQYWRIKSYGMRIPIVPPWPLTNLIPAPLRAYKVVFDMSAPLPNARDAILRQVVVRIHSTQEFDLNDGKGLQTKDLTEYVVIQQLTWDGKSEPWRIWGTIKPSTPQQIEVITKDNTGRTRGLMEQFRASMPANFGGGI